MRKTDKYIEDRKKGMSAAEVAEKHGVSIGAVYNGWRRSEMVESPLCPPEIIDERRIRKDCVMYRELDDGSRCCTGLKGLYCGVENCKFYKPLEEVKR